MFSTRPAVRFFSATALVSLAALLLPATNWAANEIGFIEKFALAPDRAKVLAELVPGSEDYYFFHALHYQNTRNEAKLAEILKQWETRFPNETARRRIILNREALLDYDTKPQETLAYLRQTLDLHFDHEQQARDQKPNLPTTLDPAKISREVFEREALSDENPSIIENLSEEIVADLVRRKVALKPELRRAVLAKITRPDVPNLVEFIAAELKMEDSGGFGSFTIHRQLLPEQLDALAKLVPDVALTEDFVNARLRKLAPNADADIDHDDDARAAWLTRVWAYAKTLPPAFNTVKAHVLYHRLDHDRKRGVYQAELLVEYLKLPNYSPWAPPKRLERPTDEDATFVNENTDFSETLPGFRPFASEPLVRAYFLELFQRGAAANPGATAETLLNPYKDFVSADWLKPILGEALITSGQGSPERWASLLTPTAFQALKDRVDIEFPSTNPPAFAPGADVQFDVTLKNTPKVLVKIYELNTLNFFLTQKRQLNTDVNLDGLVPNVERTETLDQSPFKRAKTTFKFPELKGRRGAWIVEFIGGGRSSRALLRVGQWKLVQATGPSGDILTVLDEQGAEVKDAVAWLDGRKYSRDEKLGGIVVPFTEGARTENVVLSDSTGSFCTLAPCERHQEAYKLDVQFHVEREQLLTGRQATVAIRPTLTLGETYLDPALLIEPRLTIRTTNRDDIFSTREIKDLKLNADGVMTFNYAVPERLRSVSFEFYAKVSVASKGGKKEELQAGRGFQINEIDSSAATKAGFLSKVGDQYLYEVLGKNGEPIGELPMYFEFFRRGFHRPQMIVLKTDEKGRIQLGALAGIAYFHASFSAEDTQWGKVAWHLEEDNRTWPQTIHTGEGQPVRVPLPLALWGELQKEQGGEQKAALRRAVSLLQTTADTYTADLVDRCTVVNGFLTLNGLKPGDYTLLFRREAQEVRLLVSGGKYQRGWYLGSARNLQAKAENLLQIVQVGSDADSITIKLANPNLFTRVHVAASRYYSGGAMFAQLGRFPRFSGGAGTPARLPNLYSAGREIGDEYRYILDRRYARLLPGNLLTRPGLLLNPWATRDTGLEELHQKLAQAAESTAGGIDGAAKSVMELETSFEDRSDPLSSYNLDFLAAAAPTLYNLKPDEDGLVKIDRQALGDRPYVQIYAEDLTTAVWRSFTLPETATKMIDWRMGGAAALDPAKSYTRKKETSVLTQGQTITVADLRTSELEGYDNLADLYRLLNTLQPDTKLSNFGWILEWPKMKDDEKRAKYSEFACHELSFFLARKDPEFFGKVIKPYLASKKDKTFLDDFLLELDLAKYLEPKAYGQLNAVERALLAIRLPAQAANTARELRERWELIPPDPEFADHLFDTALHGKLLEYGVMEQPQIPQTFGGMPGGMAAGNMEGGSPTFPMTPTTPTQFQTRNTGLAAAPKPSPPPSPAPAIPGLDFADAPVMGDTSHPDADGSRPAEALAAKSPITAGARSGSLAIDGHATDAFLRGPAFYDGTFFDAESAKQATAQYRWLYRKLGATQEWAENNYYQLRIGEQNADLVKVNAFWRDYAAYVAGGRRGPFVSPNIAEAAGNFTEMMLALAVLDLPFDAPKHTTKTDGNQFTFTAAGPVIMYHQQIKSAEAPAAPSLLLVSQSFVRLDDPVIQVGNEEVDKYVTDEFLTGVVYAATAVVTNPTSARVKADVLLQIPQGALPVDGSKATDTRHVQLDPYTTQTFQYYFYFPSVAKEGAKFPHFPVNVAIGNTAAAAAKPFAFQVVGKLTQVDKASWDYVSQYSTEAEVFTFLEQNNLALLNFDRVAWRCKEAGFFKKLTAFLQAHHLWSDTIYSYAIVHNDAAALREWLKHRDDFLSQCGPYLSSKLLLLDPIERRSYEHLEYSPLVNQRAHPLGAEARIANPAVLGQYQSLLTVLAHKPQLDALDGLSVTYYQFLQDRVDEALTRFKTIDAKVLPTQIQYDYLRCYADFYESNLAEARGVAAKYADFPIARWRNLFGEVTSQLDEIEGKPGVKKPDDQPDREKEQALLAASEPSVDFKVENKTIALTWKNLGEVTLNYYLMDPEFSFSSSPFVSEDASRFSIIKPSFSATQELPKGQDKLDVPLPPQFAKANVLIEVVAAGQRKAQAYHSNTLKLTLTETYGRLEARDRTTDQPLPKTYVKVYARLTNGNVRFFKDGYTDLRGRFDYASLNGSGQVGIQPVPEPLPKNGLDYQMLKPGELNSIEKLSLLILSETNGATTKEVNPPRD